MKMMDVREKIMATLAQKAGDTFSVTQIARAIGSTNKATNAALSKLFKAGLVQRPQKGLYSAKARAGLEVVAAKPSKPAPAKKAVKPAKPERVSRKAAPSRTVKSAPIAAASIITIDLLVEEEKTKVDSKAILRQILEIKPVADAKIVKTADADRAKLKVKLSFSD